MLWFTFEKITCCAKREKKIICREENPSPPPTGYQMVRPLVLTLIEDVFFACHAGYSCVFGKRNYRVLVRVCVCVCVCVCVFPR